MKNNLQSFLLNTMQSRLNDPRNARYWLPTLLTNLKDDKSQPVLPLQVASEQVGALSGSSGTYIATTLASDWIIFNSGYGNYAIPTPSSPWPTLNLSDLEMDGLDNVFMAGSTSTPTAGNTGYQSSATLQFNYYPARSTLTIKGCYELAQNVCTADSASSTACNGRHSAIVEGIGAFTATISSCFLNAGFCVSVSGTGTARALAVQVNTLDVSGASQGSSPVIDFTNITVTNTNVGEAGIAALAQQALGSPEGQAGIVQALETALNQTSTLASLAKLLTNAMVGAMDDVFSAVPTGGLPADGSDQKPATAVDLYLFDRVRVAVNNPASNWYLPWQIASSGNPVLEPYQLGTLPIPDQTIGGLSYTAIQLDKVLIAGLSNITVPNDTFVLDTSVVQALIAFATLAQGPRKTFTRNGQSVTMDIPPAPPVLLSGNFTFTQQGFSPLTVNGTAQISLSNVLASLSILPSGADDTSLELTVTGLSLNLLSAAVSPTVTLNPDDPVLDQIAEQLLKGQAAITQISSALNAKLAGQLAQLSSQFSDIARTAIRQQLSGN